MIIKPAMILCVRCFLQLILAFKTYGVLSYGWRITSYRRSRCPGAVPRWGQLQLHRRYDLGLRAEKSGPRDIPVFEGEQYNVNSGLINPQAV